MNRLSELDRASLQALHQRLRDEYDAFRAKGFRLDIARGKPAAEQLDLANAMLALPDNGDPHDSNIRITPSYAPLADVQVAAELIALCTELAYVEQLGEVG